MYILLLVWDPVMARALLLLWCTTIVAVFPLRPAAAAPLVTPVPVTAAVAVLAERLDMDPIRDRARFVPEIVRRIYSPPAHRQPPLDLSARDGVVTAAQVDIPLSPELWSERIFRRATPVDQLLAAILANRRAALLARAMWAADDETLAFYADHPALLAFLYEQAAPAFSAFASSVRVHDGRLLVPGGPAAEPLWSALVRASVDDPDAFLRALFSEPGWRTAYLFDVIAAAAPEAQRFALGSWMTDPALRTRRFLALSTAVHAQYHEWNVDELPFTRPLNDLAILLLRIQVDANGAPLLPADRRFWALALDASSALDAAGALRPSHDVVDAAWLLAATDGNMYSRGDRLDQVAFGQRVFGGVRADDSDAAAVIRELPSRRMLLLSLERIGVRDVSVYTAALRQSRNVAGGGANRFWTMAQFQGVLALVVRMRLVSTMTSGDAEALLASLFRLPLEQGEFRGGVAEWIRTSLAPHLASGGLDASVIEALAGGPTPGTPEVDWEEQRYRLDLAFAERHRIGTIRELQGGPGLDVALDIEALGRESLRATTTDAMRELAAHARELLADSGALLQRPRTETMPPGVPVPRDGRDWLARAAGDLDRAAANGDVRRANRAGASLLTLADVTLGRALLSLVYAAHLGDPEGPAMLGANVALRHDFGFGRRDVDARARGGPWALPRQDFQPGVPWHVAGSLVGLDLALAPLSLRRLSMDGLERPPRLQSIEREAFAVNVALLDPRRLDDPALGGLLARLERGRARIRALVRTSGTGLDVIERELALDGWRSRTLRQVLQTDSGSVENQFSLAEMVALGGPDPLPDAWGASGLLPFGCVCTTFPTPRMWRVLSGRTQMAMMAAANVDMTLEIARRLSALRVPAALLPAVLQTAMQDFVDRSGPADPNDFVALLDYARNLTTHQVEDYVAAAAALDGPLVAMDATGAREP